MGKGTALYDYIEADGHAVGNLFRQIGFDSEHGKEDVSGFSASGNDEFVAGKTTQDISGEIFVTDDAGGSWDVLYRLHRDRTVFAFKWRKNQNLPVSATNPQLEGNAQMLKWQDGGERGNVRTAQVAFSAADEDGFTYVTT